MFVWQLKFQIDQAQPDWTNFLADLLKFRITGLKE